MTVRAFHSLLRVDSMPMMHGMGGLRQRKMVDEHTAAVEPVLAL
jgi:hypothetical protein